MTCHTKENEVMDVHSVHQLRNQLESCKSAEDWLNVTRVWEAKLRTTSAANRCERLSPLYCQAFQWLKQNGKELSSNNAFASLLLNYAALIGSNSSNANAVNDARKILAVALKEASLVADVYLSTVDFEIAHGNVEAARWVLKRAADLKILTSDQITSLSAALADERSGSIQYGQILYVTDVNKSARTSSSVGRQALSDVTPQILHQQALNDITPKSSHSLASAAATDTSVGLTSTSSLGQTLGVRGKARRVPVRPHTLSDSDSPAAGCTRNKNGDVEKASMAEDKMDWKVSSSVTDTCYEPCTSTCSQPDVPASVCLSSASETVAHVTPVSLTVRTEVGPHTVRSLNPCGSSEMPVRNYSAVPSSFISTDSQSVSAVGHRTTAPGLLAGDLLLGPRHSGHTTADSWPAREDTTDKYRENISSTSSASCVASVSLVSQNRRTFGRPQRVPVRHYNIDDEDDQDGCYSSCGELLSTSANTAAISNELNGSTLHSQSVTFTTDEKCSSSSVLHSIADVKLPDANQTAECSISTRINTANLVNGSESANMATCKDLLPCSAVISLPITCQYQTKPTPSDSCAFSGDQSAEWAVHTASYSHDALPVHTAQPVLEVASSSNHPMLPNHTLPFKDWKLQLINGKQYVLLSVIGRGGSSKVYEALGPDMKLYAVKCVNIDAADKQTVASYRNEISLLQRLQHCSEIVRMFDHMFDPEMAVLYVVMERGEMDLAMFFRASKTRPDVLRRLINPCWMQMLYAVQALHQQGIVHSDLKPANFILVGGIVKLIDFGIAKTIQPDKTSITCDQIVGTFSYMSPEAITDLNGGVDLYTNSKPNIKISTKSDVWSLGCILYYLVYNRTPFESVRNSLLKLQAIMNPNHEIEFPDVQNPHVVDVLKKCLVRDPRRRPTVDDLLKHPYVTGGYM